MGIFRKKKLAVIVREKAMKVNKDNSKLDGILEVIHQEAGNGKLRAEFNFMLNEYDKQQLLKMGFIPELYGNTSTITWRKRD